MLKVNWREIKYKVTEKPIEKGKITLLSFNSMNAAGALFGTDNPIR